jgi:hypothetical protein
VTDKVTTPDAVQRFTTEYVVAEDRVRISLERGDGSLCVLWLTRRLTSRLVPQIVKILGALPRLQGKTEMAAPSDNAQRKNQLDALGKIEQQAPVLAGDLPADLDSHLITALGVRLTKQALLVDFKTDTETVVQTLPFSEDAIRQWLGVLHMNFRKAEWKEDVWPEWITAKGWDQGPDALRLN